MPAALLALSFTVGWLSHPKPPGNPPSGEALVSMPAVLSEPAHEPRPDQAQVQLGSDAIASAVDPKGQSLGVPKADDDNTPAIRRPVFQTVARVQIGSEGAGTDVPLLAGPGLDDGWLQAQPPPISEYDEAVLARHGYQVDQQRRLFSATLIDGRRVTVPIDQVQIVYTGANPL